MGRPHTCPYCGEIGKSVSKGVRRTKTMGDRRIRFCRACGREFAPKNQKAIEVLEPSGAEAQNAGEKVEVPVSEVEATAEPASVPSDPAPPAAQG
jgi:transcriptional regulator NrdR family protein